MIKIVHGKGWSFALGMLGVFVLLFTIGWQYALVWFIGHTVGTLKYAKWHVFNDGDQEARMKFILNGLYHRAFVLDIPPAFMIYANGRRVEVLKTDVVRMIKEGVIAYD